MKPHRLGVITALAFAVVACTKTVEQPFPDVNPVVPVLLTTYTGTLPCADCPGIVVELTLVTNAQTGDPVQYRERRTYLEADENGDATIVETGTWEIHRTDEPFSERIEYHLRPDKSDVVFRYRLVNNALRLLDHAGNDIESILNYTLVRSDTAQVLLDCHVLISAPVLYSDTTGTALDLRADGSFVLRGIIARPLFGRWTVSEHGDTLLLDAGCGKLYRLTFSDHGALGMLDDNDAVTRSLALTSPYEPIGDTLRLMGMYSYFADAGWFVECRTGIRYPVAQLGDNAALERAYLGARSELLQPLLCVIDGRIQPMPPMEGPGVLPTLVVDRFVEVRPARNCVTPCDKSFTEATRWQLIEAAGVAVSSLEGRESPYLEFDRTEHRASGHAGCNRFFAGYTITADRLAFDTIGATKMFCADGMEIETAFLNALARTTRFAVTGDTLTLSDDNAPVARFVMGEPSATLWVR